MVVFYGALDIPQHLPAHVADRRAQGKDGIRGGKIVNCLKIVLVKTTRQAQKPQRSKSV